MYSRALSCVAGLFLAVLPVKILAQTNLIVSGIVLDATTPNQSGTFIVRLDHLDTLTFSHVSYHSHSQVIRNTQSSDTLTLAVFLESETKLLPELEVTPFPATLEDFKQKIMEVEVRDPVKSLRQQQAAITYDIIMSPKVSYDAYENYRRINQPTDITLFSSGGNKGISRVLRSMGVGRNQLRIKD